MASTYNSVLWVPGKDTVDNLMRTPRSDMEKFFRDSFLALDEETKRNFLMGAAQAGALRDNFGDKDKEGRYKGFTQLDKVMKKTKSSVSWVYLAIFRTILFLFGPAFASELFKSIVPKELKG